MAYIPDYNNGGVIIYDPPKYSCTFVYLYGPNGLIPGFQIVDDSPLGSNKAVKLRVDVSSGPSQAGDVMCSSYTDNSNPWVNIPGTNKYKKGCCIAYFLANDNDLPNNNNNNNNNNTPNPKCEIFIKDSNGKLIKPNKDCCVLRGFIWDDVKKKCLPK